MEKRSGLVVSDVVTHSAGFGERPARNSTLPRGDAAQRASYPAHHHQRLEVEVACRRVWLSAGLGAIVVQQDPLREWSRNHARTATTRRENGPCTARISAWNQSKCTHG